MKFETTEQVKKTIEVTVPSFYKTNKHSIWNEYLGILNERTICTVYESERRTAVANYDSDLITNEVTNACQNWDKITELEFINAYQRALRSMSLTPELSKETELNGLFTSEKQEETIL